MADRPLILPGWAVRAVLREIEAPGTGKSQHRVIIKNRGMLPDFRGPNGCQADPECWGWEDGESGYHIGIVPSSDGDYQDFWQPFAAGDRIWVRETWASVPVSAARSWGNVPWRWNPDDDYEAAIFRASFDRSGPGTSWRSSATMLRWASRLTLLVTNVRVHRVQGIPEEDARAEGCKGFVSRSGEDGLSPQEEYRDLWESIHGPDAWERNPWVLALTFRPIPRNIDMEAASPLSAQRER